MTGLVQIVAGDADVLSSGTIILNQQNKADLYLGPNKTGFRIELIFQKSDNGKSSIKYEVPIPNVPHVKVTATNFDKQLLTANVAPLHIGNQSGRKLIFSIAAAQLGAGETLVRVVHYQIGLGEPT